MITKAVVCTALLLLVEVSDPSTHQRGDRPVLADTPIRADSANGPGTGACCIDGACQEGLTQSECEIDACGLWLGSGVSCISPCPVQKQGVCCLSPVKTDSCNDTIGEDTCECSGGTWDTSGATCADVDCSQPLGRCCLGDTCEDDYTQQQCLDACGQWNEGLTCNGPLGCQLAIGACCVGTECVNAPNPTACTCLGGTWAPGETCLFNGGNDCNNNGILDFCEGAPDCNNNGQPDECDIADGISEDCNGNGVPDECELDPDCSLNFAVDCNFDGTLNECDEDCQPDGTSDICELVDSLVVDCGGGGPDVGNHFFGQILHNGNCAQCHGSGGFGGTAPNHRNDSRYRYQWKTSGCVFHPGGAFAFSLEQYTDLEAYLSDLGGGGNGIPDECEALADCDTDGIADECELAACIDDPMAPGYDPGCLDCNQNDIPDVCDIASGLSIDCNLNGIPDDCDLASANSNDCNNNGIPDECDIASGGSEDCNDDGIPNECDADCNNNGNSDVCDVVVGGADDCDDNLVPDECEPDCNNNGVNDTCDISAGTSEDANGNGIPDECDPDCNNNGIPDDLDIEPADNGKRHDVDYGQAGLDIPDCDGGQAVVEDAFFVDFGANCETVEHLRVGVTATHSWVGDLVVELQSPSGTVVTLLSRIGMEETNPYCQAGECCGLGDANLNVELGDDFLVSIEDAQVSSGQFHPDPGASGNPGTLAAFSGEPECGLWTVRVYDGSEFDQGTLDSLFLDFRSFRVSEDCNDNKIPDECDITDGTSNDCNNNQIPDDCEDCNGNGFADSCDILQGFSDDCNNNDLPDECEGFRDCNNNGVLDLCDIDDGLDDDCDANLVPDSCDLSGLAGLFVSGFSSHNVVEYDAQTGSALGEFVTNASGTLFGATGVAFHASGDIIVSSYLQERIKRFDSATGEYLEDFVDQNITTPIDIRIGPNGNLFVLTIAGGNILQYDGITGDFIGLFATLPPAPAASLPITIRFAPNGNLVVADFSRPAVFEFDGNTGQPLGDFIDPAFLGGPVGLDFGPNGNLYVSDAGLTTIEQFDGTTGAPLGTFATNISDGNFALIPIEFGPNDNLYLAQSVVTAVAEFDGVSGALLNIFDPQQVLQPIGLTFKPASSDCNDNSVPDVCEDCNENYLADECDISSGSSQDVNDNDIPDECEGLDIEVALVVLKQAGDADATASLPESEDTAAKGESFVVEIWATDRGVLNTGLESVYLDLNFDAANVEATAVEHRPPFTGNPSGTIDNGAGLIANLGGTDLDAGGVGIEPQWRRVAVATFNGLECPVDAAFTTAEGSSGIAAVDRGSIAAENVAFGQATIQIVHGCTYNIDGIEPVNAGDFGIFAGCWLSGLGDPNYQRACDFDCSGFVDAGDVGWFATGWLLNCNEIFEEDLPPCRQCDGIAVASTDTTGEEPTVTIGWTIEPGRDLQNAATISLYAREDDAVSRGIAAAYVDFTIHPARGRVLTAAAAGAFDLLAAADRRHPTEITVGGSTMESTLGVGEWTLFARVSLEGRGDSIVLDPADITVNVADRGVALVGYGLVNADDIEIISIEKRGSLDVSRP